MQIHEILHNLPEPYKEVFSLRIFGELSFPHIAALFGKSESWAKDWAGSILCSPSVEAVYFLPDCTENEWMEYVSYMEEEMKNLMENPIVSVGKCLVTTDGYDFKQLGNKVLLWKKGVE